MQLFSYFADYYQIIDLDKTAVLYKIFWPNSLQKRQL